MKVDLKSYPEYAAAMERLNIVREKLDEAKALRSEIDGKLSERQRESRKDRIRNAAADVLATGEIRLDSEDDKRLRGDVSKVNGEIRILEEAIRLGEIELQKVRSRIAVEVTREHKDDYRSRAISVARAAVEFAKAVRDEAAFVEPFLTAEVPVGFARVSFWEGSFDLNNSDSAPCRLIQELVAAGHLRGNEDWLKDTDWNGAKEQARLRNLSRKVQLVAKGRK